MSILSTEIGLENQWDMCSTRKTHNQAKWAGKVWKEWANNKPQPDEALLSCVNAQLPYCPDVTLRIHG